MKKQFIELGLVGLIGLLTAGFLTINSGNSGLPDWQPWSRPGHQAGPVPAGNKAVTPPPNSTGGNTAAPNQAAYQVASGSRQATTKTAAAAEKYVTIDNRLYPLRIYKTLLTPNDPSAAQWWVGNATLNQAWDTPPGNRDTLLAVIDTGFGLGHEEFSGRWYANPGESGPATAESPSTLNCTDRGLPLSAACNLIDDNHDTVIDNETGPATYQNPSRLNCTAQGRPLTGDCNRRDDDGNGYVDDVTGWDFANYDNSVQAGELNPSGSGTTHGTRVTGIAAATGNNGKGLAGVDWHTKILPVQALDDDSVGDTRGVGRAILYAASRGADVISISLGSDLPDDYVRQAIQTAIAGGSVVVAAAGNTACDCMVYPANYPEVVGVGALNGNSQRASFSSWGANLDIMAPGTQMTSATWTAGNPASAYVSGINGTSFATPLVSGLLTRLLSLQPNAKPLQLIAALTENTNRLGLPATPSKDTSLGYGTVDGAKVTSRMTTAQAPTQLYAFSLISKGNLPDPSIPREISGPYQPIECLAGSIGSTPVYELLKGENRFYSISNMEVAAATAAGYSANPFIQACLLQPHDTPANVRMLNIFREFGN
jgi:hypothetical protein